MYAMYCANILLYILMLHSLEAEPWPNEERKWGDEWDICYETLIDYS